MNTKPIVKITRTIKYVIYVKYALYLTTVKNAFNKSLVENQKSYKHVQ